MSEPDIATAVDREAAWLQSHGDGLPALHVDQGGVFQTIQAYWPTNPGTRQTALYVQRAAVLDTRYAHQRRLARYEFTLKVRWAVNATNDRHKSENAQRGLDRAVALVFTRIRGLLGDHTHGGRFLSVAEAPDPGAIMARFDDPERAQNGNQTFLTADITYQAEDILTI